MRLPSSDTVVSTAMGINASTAIASRSPDALGKFPKSSRDRPPDLAPAPYANPNITHNATRLSSVTNQMVELIRPFIRASKRTFSCLYGRNGKRFGQLSQTQCQRQAV